MRSAQLDKLVEEIRAGKRPQSDIVKHYDENYHTHPETHGPFGKPEKFHAPRNRDILGKLGLDPGQRIFEAGCGAGQVIFMLDCVFDCRNVVACDFSKSSVAFCTRCYPFATALLCSVEEIPLADASFDVVLALDITEHLFHNVYLAALGEFFRLLRPGGKIALLPDPDLSGFASEHINCVPVAEVKADMEAAGFTCSLQSFQKNDRRDEWILGERPE